MASSIHHIKMSFQTHPNVPFLQGWPGILAAEPHRKPPAVHGFMELRISGNTQVKAKYLTIEFVRLEHLPNTDPAKPIVTPIGTSITAWSAPHGAEWAYLEPADFKFYIPLPLNLPGSVELKPKGGGIRYELQARLCQVHKSGVLRRESDNVMTSGQPIYITKHDLHAAWPIYNVPETRQMVLENMEMTVTRPFIAFGPTDRVEVTATLKSSRPKPLKLRAFEMQLLEIVTIRPPVPKGMKQASFPKTRMVHEVRVTVTEKIARTEAKSRVLGLTVPSGSIALTVRGGQVIDVKYELSVKAIMEGTVDLKIEHLEVIIGTYPRARSHEVVNQIGWVDVLCPRMQNPAGERPQFASVGSHNSPSNIGHLRTPSLPPGGTGSSWSHGDPRNIPFMYPDNPSPAAVDPRQRIQPFTARPLSTDASSMYSYNQARSDASSMRDEGRDDSVYGNRLVSTRPLSHIGSFAMPEPYVYNSASPNGRGSPGVSDPKRISMPNPRVMDYGSDSGGPRPVGPLRTGSGVSTRNSIASEASASRRSLDYREKSRLASLYNGSGELEAVPSRRSYIHVDAGPVLAAQMHTVASPGIGSSSGNQQRTIASPDERWSSAEAEKEKLYAEARKRAARTQAAAGGQVASMGLAIDDNDPPIDSPPSYSPSERPGSAVQSALETKLRDKPLVEKDIVSTSAPRQRSGTVVGLGIGPREDIDRDRGENAASSAQMEDRSATPSGPSSRYNNGTAVAASSPAPRAMTDKEQMKRFYDAQQAVQGHTSQASGSGSAAGSSTLAAQTTGASSSSTDAFPSAETEKDTMRRRYEQASRAVSHTYGGSDQTHDSARESGMSSGFTAGDPATRSQYLSAEVEKARMRTRYEDALRGVQGLQVGQSSTPMLRDNTHASSLTGNNASDGGSQQSFRRDDRKLTSGGEGSAVPPVPARPPAEYKTLLSPAADAVPMMPVGGGWPGMTSGLMPFGVAGYPSYFPSPMMPAMMYGQGVPPGQGAQGQFYQQG